MEKLAFLHRARFLCHGSFASQLWPSEPQMVSLRTMDYTKDVLGWRIATGQRMAENQPEENER